MAADYPVITWIVWDVGDVPGDIEAVFGNITDTVSIKDAGGSSTTVTTGNEVWGFGTDGSGNPTADSLAKRVEVALQEHSDCSACTASYDFTGVTGTDAGGNAYSGYPATKYTLTKTAGIGADEVTWSAGASTVDENTIGQSTATESQVADATSTSFYVEFNSAGYWCPGRDSLQLNVLDDRREQNIAFAAWSQHEVAEANFSHTYWGQNTILTLTYDYVDDAHCRAYRAADSTFATRAARDTDDVNNLLETLLVKGAQGETFRVYTADNTYLTVKMVRAFNFSDVATPASNSGARFTVTLPFVIIS